VPHILRIVGLAAVLCAAASSTFAQQRPAAQPAAQPQPQLARTETLNLDGWQVTCREFVNPASKSCAAVLSLVQLNQQTNQATTLIAWSFAIEEGKLTSVLQTPTGVTLAPGVEIKVGRQTRKAAFARCEPQRCDALLAIDDALSREMATAEKAETVLIASQGNSVTFNLPLKGFDRALAALRR
jgi:invasion protein IalB